MATTIEDILNASDSDDEDLVVKRHSISNINLEALLEDDDDDVVPASRTLALGGAGFLDESRSVLQEKELPSRVPFSFEDRRIRGTATNEQDVDAVHRKMGDFAAGETRGKHSIEDLGGKSRPEADLGFLASLDMAELREQRNITCSSSKDLIAVLQMKRVKSTSDSTLTSDTSSTIKYTEMDVLSTQLRRNASYKQHGPGIATAIHVHKRFIVIGTSSGLLLLFDRNQEIRQVIGSSSPQGTRCYKAVTAIDTLPSGNVIICGYLTGEIALWDVAKGSSLKRVTDIHTCRISRLQFIVNLNDIGSSSANSSNISTVPSDFTIVSVDAKGIVNRGHFSKSIWSNLSAEFDLLLDGQSGIVLDMSALSLYSDETEKLVMTGSKIMKDAPVISPLLADMNFVAFNSLTRTYIVQIQPVVRVIHRWAPPTDYSVEKDLALLKNQPSTLSSTLKPVVPASSLDWAWSIKRQYRWPVLARAWGETIQLLCIDCGAGEASSVSESRFVFTVVAENVVRTAGGGGILSVKFVDNERLVLLSGKQIFVANALLEVLETSSLPSSLGSSIIASVEVRNPDESVPASISVNASCLFVLSPDSLMQVMFQSWTQQADQLIRDGKWLEALATVLDSCGFLSPDCSGTATADSPFFQSRNNACTERYIRKYIELAVSQPALVLTPGSSGTTRSHFHLVSGVCIEYCLAAGRMGLLFGEIFDSFQGVCQEHVFLEALEPFIVNRTIRNLPSHILKRMLEAETKCQSSLERCIVHLDLQQINLELISKELLDRRMYSGFLYVYACGIRDVEKAYRILFSRMTAISRDHQLEVSPGRRASSSIQIPLPSPEEAEIGYKMLLFIKYLANGKIFPRGESTTVASESVSSLMTMLLSESFQSGAGKSELSSEWQNHRFPYLSYLVLIDPGATLFCISKGIHLLEEKNVEARVLVGMYKQLFDFCQMVDAENRKIQNFLLECTAVQLCHGFLPLPPNIISVLIRHASDIVPRTAAEDLMMKLARGQSQVQPSVLQGLRDVFEDCNFWRAALLLPSHSNKQDSLVVEKFERALSYYFSLTTNQDGIAYLSSAQTTNSAIFEFIDATFTILALDGVSAEATSAIVKILAQATPNLADINLGRTRSLISSYMLGQVQEVILATAKNPSLQLDLLTMIVEHVEREPEKELKLSEVLRGVEIQAYIRLLVSFAPDKIFPFLVSNQDCTVEGCLDLCREKKIVDATSFLLEKAGEIGPALALLLAEFTRLVEEAKVAVDGLVREQDAVVGDILSKSVSSRTSDAVASIPMYSSLEHLVNCVCGLCSRSATDGSARSSEFWFTALDHFLEKKRKFPLVGQLFSVNSLQFLPILSSENTRKGVLLSTSSEIVSLAIGKILQHFLSHMKVFVPSQDIVRRITQGLGNTNGSRFSEFKDILLSMMDAYSHEVKLLELTLKIHQSNLHEMQARRIFRIKRAVRLEPLSESIAEDTIQLSTRVVRPASRKLRSALKATNELIASDNLPAYLPINPPPFFLSE